MIITTSLCFFQGLTIVTHVLREGGKFIAKIFRGKDTSLLYCQVSLHDAIEPLISKFKIVNLSIPLMTLAADTNLNLTIMAFSGDYLYLFIFVAEIIFSNGYFCKTKKQPQF